MNTKIKKKKLFTNEKVSEHEDEPDEDIIPEITSLQFKSDISTVSIGDYVIHEVKKIYFTSVKLANPLTKMAMWNCNI